MANLRLLTHGKVPSSSSFQSLVQQYHVRYLRLLATSSFSPIFENNKLTVKAATARAATVGEFEQKHQAINERRDRNFHSLRETVNRKTFTLKGNKSDFLSSLSLSCEDKKMSSSHNPPKTPSCTSKERCLSINNINPYIKKMEYAVRGALVIRAGELEKDLKAGKKLPFNEIIRTNIGDCHAMGQIPITYIRQVLALVIKPDLAKTVDYPEDVKKHADDILNACAGRSIGSYSESIGMEAIRQNIANYIECRDGHPADPQSIILSAGASPAIRSVLALFKYDVDGKTSGIMVPVPQYPLYSASITELGMDLINYHLDEDNNWGLCVSELERALNEAKKTCTPRALVVINPGNPTGQVLTEENIQDIIKFAHANNLFLFADEVYQHNIYDENSEFVSFKKAMMDMGPPYNELELGSFMSCSKGYMGECGIRGGYVELINMCPNVKAMYYKSLSAQLCATTVGQATLDCVVKPPCEGDPSYNLYMKERSNVLNQLKERAELVCKVFNTFEGFTCNPVQGAMYAFPRITIPPKAIEAAEKAGMLPDVFYCFQLLENTGVCIVPGSGFGQKEGTYHFRTTILAQTDKLKLMLKKFEEFHTEFLKKYQ